MLDGLEKFFKFVLERSKEINGGIHLESGEDDCENLLNELLLHMGVTTSRATSGDRKNDPNMSGQR